MKKIRCSECGGIIALEIEPITDKGGISIMCNNRKPNGKRCKTINIIGKIEGGVTKSNGVISRTGTLLFENVGTEEKPCWVKVKNKACITEE